MQPQQNVQTFKQLLFLYFEDHIYEQQLLSYSYLIAFISYINLVYYLIIINLWIQLLYSSNFQFPCTVCVINKY